MEDTVNQDAYCPGLGRIANGEGTAPIEFIRLPEVRRLTGLSTSSIYEKTTSGSFPKQVKLGPRAVAWVKAEVNAWAAELVAKR